jgi:hypothetical protein
MSAPPQICCFPNLLSCFAELSESGFSGFWDFQDGFNPEHPQILQIMVQTVTNTFVYSVFIHI